MSRRETEPVDDQRRASEGRADADHSRSAALRPPALLRRSGQSNHGRRCRAGEGPSQASGRRGRVMPSQLVETVLREMRAMTSLDMAARKSRNLSPWFEENDARLRVVANMIERVASVSRGRRLRWLRSRPWPMMRRVITARLPDEAGGLSATRESCRASRRSRRPTVGHGPIDRLRRGEKFCRRSAIGCGPYRREHPRHAHRGARTTILPDERDPLRQYSGLGRLSLIGPRGRLPLGVVARKRALIHEYYTPTLVARAIAESLRPRLLDLAPRRTAPHLTVGGIAIRRGAVRRWFDSVRWYACEYSRISGSVLAARQARRRCSSDR